MRQQARREEEQANRRTNAIKAMKFLQGAKQDMLNG